MSAPPNTFTPPLLLRDYFAAAALPGVLQARATLAVSGFSALDDSNQESIAEECYELANALLEARQKPEHD